MAPPDRRALEPDLRADDAAGIAYVIRRPPIGNLLPEAHDMHREYRLLKALWPTAVPVAEPIAYIDNPAICDALFLLMEKTAGKALYTGADAERWMSSAVRKRASETLIDTLAALHSVDPAAVGLGNLGRGNRYVARQLHTWYAGWQSAVGAAGFEDRRVDELHSWLAARIPEQDSIRVVHGDYGPHNTLFDEGGNVTAVLDWELSTLGDPLADFPYTLNAWIEPADTEWLFSDPSTALPGFASRSELIDRYREATGADLVDLRFYRSFNYLKSASILMACTPGT